MSEYHRTWNEMMDRETIRHLCADKIERVCDVKRVNEDLESRPRAWRLTIPSYEECETEIICCSYCGVNLDEDFAKQGLTSDKEIKW